MSQLLELCMGPHMLATAAQAKQATCFHTCLAKEQQVSVCEASVQAGNFDHTCFSCLLWQRT